MVNTTNPAAEDNSNPNKVIIFLDVDGVLNDKWIGHVDDDSSSSSSSSPTTTSSSSTKNKKEEERFLPPSPIHPIHPIHPHLLDNLVQLILRLERLETTTTSTTTTSTIDNDNDNNNNNNNNNNNGSCFFEPVIVLSTTWRLQQRLRDVLLSSFASKRVGTNNRTLVDYLNRFNDGDGDGDVVTNDSAVVSSSSSFSSSWSTPDLDHGTTPEGRASEINAWLSAHCSRHPTIRRKDLLFLILDDLDLLYTDAGKRNPIVDEQHFVCTVSYTGYRQVEGKVGLTQDRVELALCKMKEQVEAIYRRKFGTGRWDVEEWDIISDSLVLKPHLAALRSDGCPPLIAEIAQRYVKEEKRKTRNDNDHGGGGDSGSSHRRRRFRFWRWGRWR